jgi:hypothetical protein
MPQRHAITVTRAIIEIAFIIFLFYANLLMGEFTVSGGHGKTWSAAFMDICTVKTFGIALVAAVVGFVGFETLRRKSQ